MVPVYYTIYIYIYIYKTQDKTCKLKHDIDQGLQDLEIRVWEEFGDSAVHFVITFVRCMYGRWL